MRCRLCNGGVALALSLGATPVANALDSVKTYPLELVQCVDCGHVQIGFDVPEKELYSGYKYSTPDAQRPYLMQYAKNLVRLKGNKASVLEIGCNNGLFIQCMLDAGLSDIVGIDPAAPADNPYCIRDYFNTSSAKTLGKFDLIVANNVLAHVGDLNDTFYAIKECLHHDGILVFENQYFPDQVLRGHFDNIYHEHKDYHQIESLKLFTRKHNLCLYDVLFTDQHGGAARFTVKNGKDVASETQKSDIGINWKHFSNYIWGKRQLMRQSLQSMNGGTGALFGAAAKVVTRLHVLGLTDYFDYCVDDTPEKQGHMIPGTSIPIVPASEFERNPPGYIHLGAWNYRDVFTRRFPDLARKVI